MWPRVASHRTAFQSGLRCFVKTNDYSNLLYVQKGYLAMQPLLKQRPEYPVVQSPMIGLSHGLLASQDHQKVLLDEFTDQCYQSITQSLAPLSQNSSHAALSP